MPEVSRTPATARAVRRYLTPPSGQGRRTPTMIPVRVRAVAFVILAAIGAAAYLLLSSHGARAALSYAGGVAVAAMLLIGGVLAVRAGAALSPAVATAMALSTYTTVVAVLAALLAVADPHVVDAPACALGLVVGVVVGVALQVRDAAPPARQG